MRRKAARILGAATLGLAACVTDVSKVSERVALTEAAGETPDFVLAEELHVVLPRGLSVPTLRPGTRWTLAGTIPRGRVYRPVDTVLMVQSHNAYEGYLVVSDGYVTGVYLPVEDAVIDLTRPVRLPRAHR